MRVDKFMLVRPEPGAFNSLYFDFSSLDREKELIKYIGEVRFLSYLEKMIPESINSSNSSIKVNEQLIQLLK